LGTNQDNFKLHRFTISENIAKKFHTVHAGARIEWLLNDKYFESHLKLICGFAAFNNIFLAAQCSEARHLLSACLSDLPSVTFTSHV